MKPKRTRKSNKQKRIKTLEVVLILGITFPAIYISSFGMFKLSIYTQDFSTPISHAGGERIMEPLNRGLVALFGDNDSEVYLSWRLLRHDPENITFNIYQHISPSPPVKINSHPINQTTDFQISNHTIGAIYFVRSMEEGIEFEESNWVSVQGTPGEIPYIAIPFLGDYSADRIGIADLDGDMVYDFVIKHPKQSLDPLGRPFNPNRGWYPSPDTYKIEAYGSNFSNGTLWTHMWTNDLGWNIELGIHYSPFIVYDLDGDGLAEISIKTGHPTKDYRGISKRVATGPEYLSIWNGLTGETLTQQDWPSREMQIYSWNSRNQMGIAYLDGVHPSILAERGTYATMKLDAYRFNGTDLSKLWAWKSYQEHGWKGYNSQGAHFFHSADIDGDLMDEIVLGACAIDQTGIGLWNTKLGHPDHAYVGDIDPNHPGLEVYVGIEGKLAPFPEKGNGMALIDGSTGEIIWGSNETTYHIHSQCLVSDIDEQFEGMECYSGESDTDDRWLFAANGTLIEKEDTLDSRLAGTLKPKVVFWDADLQRELLIGGEIFDFNTNTTHTTNIPGNQHIWADIFGDWREEIIVSVDGELRIYFTTIPANDRRVCLMQDPLYRNDVAHLSMGYSQVPLTSYCLASV